MFVFFWLLRKNSSYYGWCVCGLVMELKDVLIHIIYLYLYLYSSNVPQLLDNIE